MCNVLEESYVQAQLYGLRWSRLMLGREFAVTADQLFLLWDYMFAASYDAESPSGAGELVDDDVPTNIYSMLANARLLGNLKSKNLLLKTTSCDKFSYVCTPLLGVLGDFMLAMLLQVRY